MKKVSSSPWICTDPGTNQNLKEMQIIDKDGKPMAIADLNKAIQIADRFRNYRHVDPPYNQLTQSLMEYWQDIYEKLVEIKMASLGLINTKQKLKPSYHVL